MMADAEMTERVTLRIPKAMVERGEDAVEAGMYPNLSEALRDGMGDKLGPDGEVTRELMADDPGITARYPDE